MFQTYKTPHFLGGIRTEIPIMLTVGSVLERLNVLLLFSPPGTAGLQRHGSLTSQIPTAISYSKDFLIL